MDLNRIITALVVVVGIPAVLVGYIWATEQVLRPIPEVRRARIRPWLWLAPALLILFIYLVYPTIQTIIWSFMDKFSLNFVGLNNYEWFFGVGGGTSSIVNNILWLVLLTAGTVVIGTAVAVLADRVRYEAIAKSILFMPMAISAVAASLIWKFMYAYQPAGSPQTGTLNEVVTRAAQSPVPFLADPNWKLTTFALIFIMIWMWTGFGTVIISSALKSINQELLEAARVDGATEWQVFRRIILPLLAPTMAVVATTMIITALKAFDIVYTLTNGNYDTQVIANQMYNQAFQANHTGRASAIAVVLLLAIIPLMAVNIRRFQTQEAIR